MDWAKLNEISNAVAAKMNPPGGAAGPTPAPGTGKPRVGPGPTVDGRLITIRSFCDAAPEMSKNLPLLFGSVIEEGNIHAFPANGSRVAGHPYEELR
jgi:para-nitrobenzyl esterase